MADQVAAWLSSDAVARQLKLVGHVDGQALPADAEDVRLGVAAYIEPRRRDLVTGEPATFTPTDDVVLGALLLCGRLHARQGSPQGLASFGEFGVTSVLRTDPDAERLLGIGRYGKPAVG